MCRVKLWRTVIAACLIACGALAGCGSPSAPNQPDWAERRVILVPGVCLSTSNLPPPPALPPGLPPLPKHPSTPNWLGCGADTTALDASQRALETFSALANRLAIAARGQVAVPKADLRVYSYDASSPSSYTPSATHQSLDLSAATLAGEFKAWHQAEPTATFDLVGHSLGGDVILLWAARYATPQDLRYVHSIVTLDAPVQGYPEPLYGYLLSYLSPLFGTVANSLASDSATMRSLIAAPGLWQRGPDNAPSAVYNYGNLRDVVVPAFITTLTGTGGVIDDFGVGPDDFNHGAILRNTNAVAQVAALIQSVSAPALARSTAG
jgi:pimeloyl-ACP methyl ester carboxylesterase